MSGRSGSGARASGATAGLCLTCGLCCDGSLFWAVPLEPDETVPGAVVETDGGERRLVQPCAFHEGPCRIYATRPAGCRAFTCLVLKAVEAGERDRLWAERRIGDMRVLLAALDAVLPGAGGSLYARAAAYLEDPPSAPADPAVQARLAVYEDLLTMFRPLHMPGGPD